MKNLFNLLFNTFFIASLLFLSGCGRDLKVVKRPASLPQRSVEQPKNLVAPDEIKRDPKNLTIQELTRARDYYLAITEKEMAIKYVEEMIKKSTDQKLLQGLRLELADLYFETGKMEESSKMYTSYLALYPGSEYRAYAHYQAILCRFYMGLSTDRDQTKTNEALLLTQEYMKRSQTDKGLYGEYLTEIHDIHNQCSRKLFESDMNIFNFYYKKGSYKACQVHLENMKKRFFPLIKDEAEPEILQLECSIAEKQGDSELLMAKRSELSNKYPQQNSILLAHNEKTAPKRDYVKIF